MKGPVIFYAFVQEKTVIQTGLTEWIQGKCNSVTVEIYFAYRQKAPVLVHFSPKPAAETVVSGKNGAE